MIYHVYNYLIKSSLGVLTSADIAIPYRKVCRSQSVYNIIIFECLN